MLRNFYCKLVHNGHVKEAFFREGESKEEVKKELENFQWPEGKWVITDEELEGQGDYCCSNLDEYLDAFEAVEVARFVGKLIRGRPKPKTIEERLEANEIYFGEGTLWFPISNVKMLKTKWVYTTKRGSKPWKFLHHEVYFKEPHKDWPDDPSPVGCFLLVKEEWLELKILIEKHHPDVPIINEL
jgi:hypothetical protein